MLNRIATCLGYGLWGGLYTAFPMPNTVAAGLATQTPDLVLAQLLDGRLRHHSKPSPVAQSLKSVLKWAGRERPSEKSVKDEIFSISTQTHVLLSEVVGKALEYDLRCLPRLAVILKCRMRHAAEILLLWQQYCHPGAIHLSESASTKARSENMEKLRRSLKELHAGNPRLSAKDLAAALPGVPIEVRESFHNVVMNTGRDEPRLSVCSLEQRIGYRLSAMANVITEWELFWEEEVKRFGFETKPGVTGGNFLDDVIRAMAYAKAARWNLMKMERWLIRELGNDPRRRYVLDVFYAIFDVDAIHGRRGRFLPRPTATELSTKIVCSVNEDALKHWEHNWETLAADLGQRQFLRPVNPRSTETLGKWEKGDEREDIFREAQASGLGARFIHDSFVHRGWLREAQVVGLLLEGVNDEPGLAVSEIISRVEKTSQKRGGVRNMVDRFSDLARQFGLAVKELPPDSQERRANRKAGSRIQALLEEARQEHRTLLEFQACLESDEELSRIWDGQATRMLSILDAFLKRGGRRKGILGLHRRRFETVVPYGTFMGWWRRFEEWRGELEN